MMFQVARVGGCFIYLHICPSFFPMFSFVIFHVDGLFELSSIMEFVYAHKRCTAE
ncbi:hypothetical protein HanPSC8_Chr17g0794631 [Helianthus annuus]|nr:hypothetical protein HanPSC8_Chr17g0794631 [Helianthus annuus]